MRDYSEEQDSAYNDIAEAGGVVNFLRPPTNTVPADPDAAWEGNNDPGKPFVHVAVTFPLAAGDKTDPDANHKTLIPGKGLPFEIRRDQEFTDSMGRKYAVKTVQTLAPNPAQVILYKCEVALWPAI